MDLSVGVVPLSAVLPSEPPAVAMAAPVQPAAPLTEATPDLPAMPEPLAMPRPDLPPPVMDLPQAEAPPVMAAAPPPPEEPPLAMAQSPRPVARPDRSQPARARDEVQPAEAARPAAPETEAQAEAKQRAPSAAAPAQAAGSDQAAQPAQERRVAGGQAAARYGDQVMRQIARLRRQKAPERGVVVVGFEIGADGGLRRVAVVSSSGSEALDLVALDHIRRAAPFPPPPEGAALRFAFEFVGR
jgi:protein TonB